VAETVPSKKITAEKPVKADPTVPAADQPPTNRPLTPEEQMAAYEKDLRENDWGHQPC
jgi:hypothetical protein